MARLYGGTRRLIEGREMHKKILLKKLDHLEEVVTNHIPSQIESVKRFMFRGMWGLALTIIAVLGGMTTALILLIAKGL